jgi:hypothetical protein
MGTYMISSMQKINSSLMDASSCRAMDRTVTKEVRVELGQRIYLLGLAVLKTISSVFGYVNRFSFIEAKEAWAQAFSGKRFELSSIAQNSSLGLTRQSLPPKVLKVGHKVVVPQVVPLTSRLVVQLTSIPEANSEEDVDDSSSMATAVSDRDDASSVGTGVSGSDDVLSQADNQDSICETSNNRVPSPIPPVSPVTVVSCEEGATSAQRLACFFRARQKTVVNTGVLFHHTPNKFSVEKHQVVCLQKALDQMAVKRPDQTSFEFWKEYYLAL